MLPLPCGPVDVETGIVLTYDAIFPENDGEEKDVNQLALGSAGSNWSESSACDNKSAAACGDTGLAPVSTLMRCRRFSYRGRRHIPIGWLDSMDASRLKRTT
jgi:hypothetical protein